MRLINCWKDLGLSELRATAVQAQVTQIRCVHHLVVVQVFVLIRERLTYTNNAVGMQVTAEEMSLQQGLTGARTTAFKSWIF